MVRYRYKYIFFVACLIFVMSSLFVAAYEETYPPDYFDTKDYDTYEEFYKSADIEKITTFIPYSHYERLGKLEKVTLTHWDTMVQYEIIDQNGFHLYVSVGDGCARHKGQSLHENFSKDLRHLMGKDHSIEEFWHYKDLVHPKYYYPCICSENASYFYERDDGHELRSIAIRLSTDPENKNYCSFVNITWPKDNTMALSEYPLNGEEPSYFARLLKAETADAAIAEIRDMANGQYVKKEARMIAISATVAAVIVIPTAIALPIVIIKRKRKKAAMASGE